MRLGGHNARADRISGPLGRAALGLAIFAVGMATGRRGWPEAVTQQGRTLAARFTQGGEAERLPTLTMDIAFEAYGVLLGQREQALKAGVYASSTEGFVPAVVRLGGAPVAVRVQLEEGTALNLGPNDKWPFELRVAGELPPGELEFDHFYLRDPASSGWLSQWAFAEAMQQEGLMARRTRFVRLIVNGDDHGIYALQEGYGRSLAASQGNPPGVIIGSDSAPLWTAVAQFGGRSEAAFADPVTNLSLQDFRTLSIKTLALPEGADTVLTTGAEGRATSLLYSLQTGQRSASEVFDAGSYGRFLALADLWGATQATSPLNLSFYYNAAEDRLEPVVAGVPALDSYDRLSLAAAFADPRLQMAYAQEADRISQPAYLELLEERMAPLWQRLSDALQAELRNPDPPWEMIGQRQAILQQSLHPSQPILAYGRSSSELDHGLLQIDIANAINLPVQILGFDLAGATFMEVGQARISTPTTEILDGWGDGVTLRAAPLLGPTALRVTTFQLPLDTVHTLDDEADFNQDLDISVAIRLLGLEDIQLIPVSRELMSSTGGTQP